MKSWQPNIYLTLAVSMVGIISTLVTQPASAEAKLEKNDQKVLLFQGSHSGASVTNVERSGVGWGNRKIRQLSEFETLSPALNNY